LYKLNQNCSPLILQAAWPDILISRIGYFDLAKRCGSTRQARNNPVNTAATRLADAGGFRKALKNDSGLLKINVVIKASLKYSVKGKVFYVGNYPAGICYLRQAIHRYYELCQIDREII
jgi:hypothetical protein